LSSILIPSAFRDLFDVSYRDYAYYGGRGGAKSHSVGGALVIQAAKDPLRIVCAREIQDSIKDSVKQLIEDKISDYGLSDAFEALRDETRAKNGGGFIYKGMWRNPDAIKSLEGADVFWGEEANRFSAKSIKLVRPTMRKVGSRMIWTWNPEYEHDPIDRIFRGPSGPPPNSFVKKVSHLDNPWFKDSPLQAELDHDYRVNADVAEHVWGGGYVKAVEGAYYAGVLADARKAGRIGFVDRDPIAQVYAFWDIGVRDATAIWICQIIGREIRVLDYYEAVGQPLAAHLEWLRHYGWGNALCVLPHDGNKANEVTAQRFEDHVRQGGFNVVTVPNQGKGAALQRIEAARRVFGRCWFDQDACNGGLKALGAYHEKRDEQRNIGLGPNHDWASHGADAFGLMAVYINLADRPDDPYDEDDERRSTGSEVTGY
jgi:phage terminase large subunit